MVEENKSPSIHSLAHVNEHGLIYLGHTCVYRSESEVDLDCIRVASLRQ